MGGLLWLDDAAAYGDLLALGRFEQLAVREAVHDRDDGSVAEWTVAHDVHPSPLLKVRLSL